MTQSDFTFYIPKLKKLQLNAATSIWVWISQGKWLKFLQHAHHSGLCEPKGT